MECHKIIKRRETFIETVGYVQHTQQMQGSHRKHKITIITSGNTINNIEQVRTMFKLVGCEIQELKGDAIKEALEIKDAPEEKQELKKNE